MIHHSSSIAARRIVKRNTHQRQRRDEELSRIVEDYWASQIGEDPKLDLRVLGATSLDLLGHELGLRRLTGLSISFESIVGPVTLESIIEMCGASCRSRS